MKNLHPALVRGLLAAVVVASPAAASAQDTIAARPPGGWIGIVTDTVRPFAGRSDDPALGIRVTAVQVSGPAELGGVRPGDIVLAWNGRALDSQSYQAWLSAVADLDPGQPIVLRLMRDGVERDVTVVASDLPAGEYDLRLDMTGFTITMDDSSMSVGYRRLQVSPDARTRAERFQGIGVVGAGGADPPGGAGVVPNSTVAELGVDSMALDTVADELAAPRGTAGMTRRLAEDIDRAFAQAAQAGAFPVSPLDPFALGSVVLGGARVRTLSGGLGRYFGLEQGVLVLEVVTMSPASSAGFRPGDVVVAVADSEVATLAQLRAQLSVAQLPVQVTVVRRGERVALTYPVR